MLIILQVRKDGIDCLLHVGACSFVTDMIRFPIFVFQIPGHFMNVPVRGDVQRDLLLFVP